jgi:hypothetical protein
MSALRFAAALSAGAAAAGAAVCCAIAVPAAKPMQNTQPR